MKAICKNCGHPVRSIWWIFGWFHVTEDKYQAHLTGSCRYHDNISECGCPYPAPKSGTINR